VSLTAGFLLALLLPGNPPDDPAFQPALQKFRQDYHKSGAKDDEKIAAVRALACIRHEKIVRMLAPLLTEAPLTVRLMTARELGRFAGVEAAPRELLAALKSPANAGKREAPVRIEILRGLGYLRYTAAAADIAKLVGDREVWVAKAAVDAAGRVRAPEAMVPLIKALRRIEARSGDAEVSVNPLDDLFPEMPTASSLLRPDVRQAAKRPSERELLRAPILAALQAITRQTWETSKDWDAWWTKRKGTFTLPE
jgi:HEAT repeat protein